MTAGKGNPITVRMIDHVVIRTKALAPMLAFYSEVLGCPVERRQEKFGLIQLKRAIMNTQKCRKEAF